MGLNQVYTSLLVMHSASIPRVCQERDGQSAALCSNEESYIPSCGTNGIGCLFLRRHADHHDSMARDAGGKRVLERAEVATCPQIAELHRSGNTEVLKVEGQR